MWVGKDFSLNDILIKGSQIQPDIFDVLIQFWEHLFLFKADIDKMYRQVLIENDNWNLQCIYSLENPDNKICTFHFCTVTYSKASTSFLATNCLNILGRELFETDQQVGKALLEKWWFVSRSQIQGRTTQTTK